MIQLPTPRFIVFYNGEKPANEREILSLSDAFQWPTEMPDLEVHVTQLNINAGYNEDIKEACHMLKEYMQYVAYVRDYVKIMPLKEAVEKAIDICIEKGILADFLRKNRAEVYAVSLFEYDAERVRRILIEENLAEGERIGEKKGEEKAKLQYRQLILSMLKDGRENEIPRLAVDEDFEKEMMGYYKIQ